MFSIRNYFLTLDSLTRIYVMKWKRNNYPKTFYKKLPSVICNFHILYIICNSDKLLLLYIKIFSDQIRSVAQSCPTLCDPMNHSTPGLPIHHQLPEFTQTHVHRVRDAIQPSHPLSSPSPPAPNPSQHQSLFQ